MPLSRVSLARVVLVLTLSQAAIGCTPPPAADRRDGATGNQSAIGPAGGPAGVPFFATSEGFLRSLAGLVATGMGGVTGTRRVATEPLDEAPRGEIAERYRRALEAACRERGLALAQPSDSSRLSIRTRIVKTERLAGDRLRVSVETVARSRESGEVIWRHDYQAIVGDLLLESTH